MTTAGEERGHVHDPRVVGVGPGLPRRAVAGGMGAAAAEGRAGPRERWRGCLWALFATALRAGPRRPGRCGRLLYSSPFGHVPALRGALGRPGLPRSAPVERPPAPGGGASRRDRHPLFPRSHQTAGAQGSDRVRRRWTRCQSDQAPCPGGLPIGNARCTCSAPLISRPDPGASSSTLASLLAEADARPFSAARHRFASDARGRRPLDLFD